MKVELNGSYPKVIDYYGTAITIKSVKYEKNRLIVEILNNDNIDYMGVSYIDGESAIEGYFESSKIHGLVFDIDKRDSYYLDLGIILKHKRPIDIEIENKFSK